MTLISEHEVTDVWSGIDAIISNSLKVLSKVKYSYDLCTNYTGPISINNVEPMRAAHIALKDRGIKIRFITEITPANIKESKQVMAFAELRHLDDIAGNFAVADGTDYAGSSDVDNATGELQKLVISNVGSFVKLQQYFFETLWAKAIPAEQKIKQVEEGRESEVTEIVQGKDLIYSKAVSLLRGVKSTHDVYLDKNGPKFICSHEDAYQAYQEVHARGAKIRMLTEITPDNVQYCKQLEKIMELRHVDKVLGNFRIIDSKIFGAMSNIEISDSASYLHSTVHEFVDLQQYFFSTLWNNATPSSSRFAEIELGRKSRRIEILHDAQQSRELGFDVLQHTQHELLVLFSDSGVLTTALELGAVAVYNQLSQRGVQVRILLPKGSQTEPVLHKIKSIAPLVETRTTNEDLNIQLTILISDRSELMTWEVREEDRSDLLKGAGISTYTNFDTLSRSYAAIFDNLWNNTEYADKLQAANLNLKNKEKAMKEFMDTAAHELRTPIQPVLGLAERLQEELELDEKHEQYLDVIIRNAKRLQKLQQDMLDVTRIDGKMITLYKERLNVQHLLDEASANFQDELLAKGIRLEINCPSSLFLMGDKDKLSQVIANILSNAIKAMEPRGVVLTDKSLALANKPQENAISIIADKTIGTEHESGGYVAIKFTDHGLGIGADMMPRLFNKFATNSRTGTGLGLYITKAIVEAHSGKIWAENNLDVKGATFNILLPLISEHSAQ